MRVGVFPVDVVDVVGGYELNVQVACQLDQLGQHPDLLGDEMVLDLDVVAVPEEVLVPAGRLVGALVVSVQKLLRDLACKTGRRADEALAVLLQHLGVDPGLVVETLQVRDAVELHEVVVALVVHCQEDEVVVVVSRVLQGSSFGVDVEFASGDRLDAGFLAGIVEVNHAEHVAVVGYGKGLHSELLCLGNVSGNGSRTVEERVVGVVVKMYEFCHLGPRFERTLNVAEKAGTGNINSEAACGSDGPPYQAPRASSRGPRSAFQAS